MKILFRIFLFQFTAVLFLCTAISAQNLVINEIMASNSGVISDPQGDNDDWIELHNPSASAVSLSGLSLSDDKGLPNKWMLPDSTVPAGGYIVIWADDDTTDSPGIHLNFKLSADGEFLGLYSGASPLDSLTFSGQYENISYGRIADGSGAFRYLVHPTPAAANWAPPVSALRSRLIINEFMASNTKTITDPQGRFADWIELHNAADSAVSILGASVTDDPLLPEKFLLPDEVILPGDYLIVWADNDDTDRPDIHTNFRLDGETGEHLGIYYSDGSQTFAVDSITFGPQLPDTSYGRYPNASGAFRFMYPATPGSSNKLMNMSGRFGAVVINELMADNDSVYQDAQGEYDDWVELYNMADSTISLAGMYLTDNPDNTRKWRFPDVSIPPGSFLIVWTDNDTLDDFFGVHTNFALSANGEFVGLYDTDANGHGLIDSVYFGPQEKNYSFGRLTDGASDYAIFDKPTPGASNNTATGIDGEHTTPAAFVLGQNYPNPFNQGTVITYQLPKTSKVSIVIYNILGQAVRELFSGIQTEGGHHLRWDGADNTGAPVASGVYIYRLQAESGYTAERTMLLLK